MLFRIRQWFARVMNEPVVEIAHAGTRTPRPQVIVTVASRFGAQSVYAYPLNDVNDAKASLHAKGLAHILARPVLDRRPPSEKFGHTAEAWRDTLNNSREQVKSQGCRLDSERNRAEIAEARLRNVIGWRENDWPEGFDRSTAELVAQLASPSAETVAWRRAGSHICMACDEAVPPGCGGDFKNDADCGLNLFVVERHHLKCAHDVPAGDHCDACEELLMPTEDEHS